MTNPASKQVIVIITLMLIIMMRVITVYTTIGGVNDDHRTILILIIYIYVFYFPLHSSCLRRHHQHSTMLHSDIVDRCIGPFYVWLRKGKVPILDFSSLGNNSIKKSEEEKRDRGQTGGKLLQLYDLCKILEIVIDENVDIMMLIMLLIMLLMRITGLPLAQPGTRRGLRPCTSACPIQVQPPILVLSRYKHQSRSNPGRTSKLME